jgi:hypothetical protein
MFFSYFVSNFICYFNVIILYNFLLIPTQPSFSYNAIDKLAQIFFNSNINMFSIITNFIQKFNINLSPQF